MNLRTSTLIPGLLVSLKSSVRGNVSYEKRDLESREEAGALVSKWETERTVLDPAEQELAIKVRSKARGLIVSVCAQSSFGLLCPVSKAPQLESAFQEAERIVADFNKVAKLTRIAVYIVAGEIAADDTQAIRSINSEMRDLMEAMQDGLRNLDAGVVREACNKARALGSMLEPGASARVKAAIDVARKAARDIVKAGETGAVEIDQAAIHTIRNARTAFLDLEEAELSPEEIAAAEAGPVTRTMDLDPETVTPEPDDSPMFAEVPGSERAEEGPVEEPAPAAAPSRFVFDLED